MTDHINIIPSHQVEAVKWDNCIRKSKNTLIYAYSFYLNHIADNWTGIVLNDYEAVMPVCWRKKWGVKYCYDVPFMQQLGWFEMNTTINSAVWIKTLFDLCRYGDYAFNYQNSIAVNNIKVCSNYVLNLFQPYITIAENFKNLSYDLKKAQKNNLSYTNTDIEATIDLYKSLYYKRFLHVTPIDFSNFKRLCKYLEQKNNVIAKQIINQKNETLASILLLKDETRLYNVINNITVEGRKAEANYLLLDNIFREFANQNLVFDFEGSDIPGIKKFYGKFGAVNQSYKKLHFNHLPFPFKLLK